MKKLILIISFLSLQIYSCKTKVKTSTNFDWLIGNWKRVNEAKGKETFEQWKKINANNYQGIGFTMQDNDTIKQERIKLIKKDDKWSLKVKTPEDKKYITFLITNTNDTLFTCKNDSLQFPNKIRYWREDDKLKALVSGKEIEIPFHFEKIN